MMKTLSFDKILVGVKEYFLMAVGIMIYTFGWIGCIAPADGTGGGAAGLATVICRALALGDISIQLGTMTFIINGILLLFAGFIVGWKFGIKTVYCVIILGFGMNFWQSVLPPGDFLHLDRLLSIILGGILAGIGIAMCFKQGGSTGGTDIVAMIINKYRTISYGRIVITCDFTIITSALLVGYHIDTVIYGFVMTAVFGYTVDMLMAGNQQSSQIFVFTRRYEAMADQIIATTRHSATILDATGWYSKEDIKVVVVVCRKRETSQLLKLVRGVDGDAFISVGSVMGVYGKGFEALNKV